jgi:hypothetical protein
MNLKAENIIAASIVAIMLLASPAVAQPPQRTSQVRFEGPARGLRVYYQVGRDGRFCDEPLVTPARLNFAPGAVYRLKLTHIPGYEGVTLYPTLEIAAPTPRSEAFLAHSSIRVSFTVQDFAQVMAGKLVTKVIYLPSAGELAGIEVAADVRGRDALDEASRRGAILAVLRLGDRELRERRPERGD